MADRKDLPGWDRTKRPSFEDYGTWLKSAHNVDLRREQARYETAVPLVVESAKQSDFWRTFLARRQDLDDAYRAKTMGYKLFAFETDMQPVAKSWDSFLLKSFRRNVLNNESWPDSPERNWLLPNNWLTEVKDIVRTSLVVKYLDGVKYLNEALSTIATDASVDYTSDLQARETGYYAAHTYAALPVSLPTNDWAMVTERLSFEVQITTQLQEVIGRLTHEQYERRRLLPDSSTLNWQWDHTSAAFQPNYLGHLLHYAEGMIMEVRDRGNS